MATGHLYVPPSNFVVPETTECWDDDGECIIILPSNPPHCISVKHCVLVPPPSSPRTDCTVMVGSSSFGPPRQPTPSKTQQRPRESSTRLPRRVGMGENERTAVRILLDLLRVD